LEWNEAGTAIIQLSRKSLNKSMHVRPQINAPGTSRHSSAVDEKAAT